MNRKLIGIITIVMMAYALPAFAAIINIPADYLTIQEGINSSADGDTVLVQPGTYVENINFNGHNITLGSLFLTTGEISYISETFIDGDSTASVIRFFGGIDDGAVIGFTIQNGAAYQGGGIYCFDSNPLIAYNVIRDNTATGFEIPITGGGIYCSESDPYIANNLIVNNVVSGSYGSFGGGIYCGESSPIIINNTISRNSSEYGAGLYCDFDSEPIATNSILWGDIATHGGEIDVDNSGSFYLYYCDIEDTSWFGWTNINSDPLFRDPANGDFRLKSIACGAMEDSPCVDTGDRNLVDITLNCDRGLRTIISDMGAYGGGDSATIDPDWVVIDIGNVHNYVTNSTHTRASGLNERTILIGDDSNEMPSMLWTEPIEYADDNHYLYYAALRLGHYRTLVHFDNATSPGLDAYEPPGSISDFDTKFEISNGPHDLYDIRAWVSTYAWNDESIDDFIIYDFWIVNFGLQDLPEIYIAFYADCDISSAGGGGGLQGYWRDDLVGYYRDYESGEFVSYMYDGDNPNIDGDDEGGRYEPRESLGYLGSRLLYCPPIVGDTIPSVQQGHSWWFVNEDPGYDSIWFDYISNNIWMTPPNFPEDYRYLQKTGPFEITAGDSINVVFAFGIGNGENGMRANLEIAQQIFNNGYVPTSVESDISMVPKSLGLQNYPNPFNPTTTIRYSLPVQSDVRIEIYNILGQCVEALLVGVKQPGYHTIAWHADDYPSGVYFARLEAGERSENIKMVLLK